MNKIRTCSESIYCLTCAATSLLDQQRMKPSAEADDDDRASC